MALKDIVIPTKRIQTEGGEFQVRGLSLADIDVLVQEHFGELEAAFDAFGAAVDNEEHADLMVGNEQVATAMLKQAFLAAVKAIALAADEPDAWQTVARLPIHTQAEALIAIAELTFKDLETAGKLAGMMPNITRAVTTGLVSMQG